MDALQTADLLHPVLIELSSVVEGIDEGQLRGATPCTEYDVQVLRDHTMAWLTTFADGFADSDGRAPLDRIADYRASEDAACEVRAAADRLDRAVRAGAGERPLKLGENAMPGDVALSMILWEYLVHGSDLAQATGQAWQPADAAADAALDFAPGMLTPDYQGVGKTFGPRIEVPTGSSSMDRLLGLSGRHPTWTAQ
jgi:uncharacterized protein (TIGR03086 family)